MEILDREIFSNCGGGFADTHMHSNKNKLAKQTENSTSGLAM